MTQVQSNLKGCDPNASEVVPVRSLKDLRALNVHDMVPAPPPPTPYQLTIDKSS